MSGRNSQVVRIFKVISILEGAPHGLTVAEIASRVSDRGHNVTERTVRRDIEAILDFGLPLVDEPDGEGAANRWRLERVTRINDHFVLTAKELLALYLARGVLTPLKDTPFFQDLNAIFQRIEDRIGKKGREHLAEMEQEIHFEPGPRWGLGLDPDILETVRACCSEKHLLKVTYSSANSQDTRERILGPHYLYFAQGSLYLVAEDMAEGKVKTFGLPRMENAAMLEEAYEGERVNPETYFSGVLGVFRGDGVAHAIQLDFSAKVSPYVRERQWHTSQRVVAKADGTIQMHLDLALTPELVQWVLGFGPEVRVVKPDELKERVKDSAEKTLALYKKTKAA